MLFILLLLPILVLAHPIPSNFSSSIPLSPVVHGLSISAFSVPIQSTRYYGGLITYSHAHHPALICRVFNACVRPDGGLVLPRWMRRHDRTLSFHCGLHKAEFSLPDTDLPVELRSEDLVGLQCPRPKMPWFLTDFMSNAVVLDLVYGDREVRKTCHSRKGRDCTGFPGLLQSFKPLVWLPSRLEDMEEKKSWVKQFVKLMKGERGANIKVEYLEKGTDEDELTCFRSALFTRGPYNKFVIDRQHLRSLHFMRTNGISKKARQVRLDDGEESKPGAKCRLNITISNRQLIDGASNRLIGRYIMNIPQLRKAIRRQAKRIRGLKVHVESLTLEGKTLRWQINAMQKTDIWVAGMGSLLTNMIFLRENGSVIELQPFAYYPNDYENMARYLAHVKHERYIANPDVEAFEACVHQLHPKGHPTRTQAMDVLGKYLLAAEKFKKADATHSYVLSSLNQTALRNIRLCAQMQRLDTDAKKLAIAVVRHARLMCGLPKPQLSSASNA